MMMMLFYWKRQTMIRRTWWMAWGNKNNVPSTLLLYSGIKIQYTAIHNYRPKLVTSHHVQLYDLVACHCQTLSRSTSKLLIFVSMFVSMFDKVVSGPLTVTSTAFVSSSIVLIAIFYLPDYSWSFLLWSFSSSCTFRQFMTRKFPLPPKNLPDKFSSRNKCQSETTRPSYN